MSQERNEPGAAAAPDENAAENAEPRDEGTADDPNALRAELDAARQQAQENWERYLREAAELQNLRKRAAEREEKARRFAVDRFAADLLNVKDSLEMGLAAAQTDATVEALREGVEATLRQLEQAFAAAGLKEVCPEGEAFDPARHEAMAMQERPTLTREEVVNVVQKGYLLHDRVLRPARVIVGKPASGGAGTPAGEAPDRSAGGGDGGQSGQGGGHAGH